MKKTIFVLALLCVVAVGVDAAERVRFETHNGEFNIDLINSDTASGSIDRIYLPGSYGSGEAWNGLIGCVYVPDCADLAVLASDSVQGATTNDTAIITYYANRGYWTEVLYADTCPLPCTSTFSYWTVPTYTLDQSLTDTTVSGESSWSGVARNHGLLLDNIYFDVHVTDTAGAGAGDSLRTTVNWWLRLVGGD